MIRAALTGGIGTGKSRCLHRLAELGVPGASADTFARAAVAPGTAALAAIATRFGAGVVDAHGWLDRSALARIVFTDAVARRDLEAIVHPAVYVAIQAWFERLSGTSGDPTPLAVVEVPLLYETDHASDFAVVIVAACTPAQQLARVMGRDGLSETEARQRIAAQLPIEEKRRRADYVIDTSGSEEETDRRTADTLATILRERRV